MRNKIKSSGILFNKNGVSILPHIQLLNVDPNDSRDVTLHVIDWGNAATLQTNPVGTLLNFSGTIPPNTRRSFVTEVLGGHHYEIRVTYDGDDFSINTFALPFVFGPPDPSLLGWLEGFTVLNNEFFKIELD